MENIINQGTPITIEEKEYTLRRLNIRDVFKVATLLGKVYKPGFKYEEGQESSFSAMFLSAIPVAENDIISFLSSLLGITVDEFDKLPPDALFDIVDALSKSEDLKRFFDKVKAMMSKLNLQVPSL